MEHPLRPTLADRAFLFDDPAAYLAGVDAALRAIAELESTRLDSHEHSAVPRTNTSR
ncbi:MAG: hypothetical protein WD080_07725 [Egibacteraceae bacterium]